MQRRQLTKTINVSAYKIILTYTDIYPYRQELLHRPNIISTKYETAYPSGGIYGEIDVGELKSDQIAEDRLLRCR